MAEAFGGLDREVVVRAIEALGDQLGEPILAKPAKSRPGHYYDLEQQRIIFDWLRENARQKTLGKLAWQQMQV